MVESQASPLLAAHLRYCAGDLRLDTSFTLTERHNTLFGPSGVGKSTVLRLLAGLLSPDKGRLTLEGRVLLDTASSLAIGPGQRTIGYVTQEPALFPHLTVERNIGFGLYALGRTQRRSRVGELLELFALQALCRRFPHRLSGGERQRVALARALASRPRLLLLDEPFTALDSQLKQETARALDRCLAAQPTTVLAVSHDVAEVYASGTQVLLLERGTGQYSQIAGQGPARTVLATHRENLLRQLGAGHSATHQSISDLQPSHTGSRSS